jgi:hypothetical protein
MSHNIDNITRVLEITKLGVPTLLNGVFQVTETKIGKSPTHYAGSFMARHDFQVLVEVRVYSATYVVLKLYRRGKAVETLREQTVEDAINKILIPAGF